MLTTFRFDGATKGVKLAIVGSRTFNDYGLLCKTILQNYKLEQIGCIVSGGAKGADSLGERFAKENGKDTMIFKAEWDKYGKSAGFRRNIDIIEACDECIAFWDGVSHGTKHDIDLCKERGKSCIICYF